MNARQRRARRRRGTRFVLSIVDALRPLEAKIINDPQGASQDFREILDGVDRELLRPMKNSAP